MADLLGLYVHVPWCRTLCPYCDFAVHIKRGPLPHRAYLDALINELQDKHAAYAGVLQTVYIGGGTPSLWEPACVAALLANVRARFAVAPSPEITLEVNPIDCTPENLAAWRAAGCNRLSIGVQALDAATLAFLERGPHHGDGATAVARARAAGFDNLSVDFILGAGPKPPLMEAIAALAPSVTHMSVYELTIEARTRFGRRQERGRLPMASEDVLVDAFTEAHELLGGLGFVHYEISSYARPGRQSQHNAAYWTGRPYLGIGVGAASLWRETGPAGGAKRSTNLRSTPAYLRHNGWKVTEEVQQIEPLAMERELLWLAMRTLAGASEQRLARFDGLVDWLLGRGLAIREDDRLVPTLSGFLFANQVASRVLEAPVRLP